MGTRCLIGIINQDGTGQYIRVNCDGYPEWVGRLLAKNHATRDKASEVIAMGDLSNLGRTLQPKSDFVDDSDDLDIDGTTAHHRDWQRAWAEVGPRDLGHGLVQFGRILKESDCLYGYAWIGGGWLVCIVKEGIYKPLTALRLRDNMPNPFEYPLETSEQFFGKPYKDCTIEELEAEFSTLGEYPNLISVQKRESVAQEVRKRGLNPHDVL